MGPTETCPGYAQPVYAPGSRAGKCCSTTPILLTFPMEHKYLNNVFSVPTALIDDKLIRDLDLYEMKVLLLLLARCQLGEFFELSLDLFNPYLRFARYNTLIAFQHLSIKGYIRELRYGEGFVSGRLVWPGEIFGGLRGAETIDLGSL